MTLARVVVVRCDGTDGNGVPCDAAYQPAVGSAPTCTRYGDPREDARTQASGNGWTSATVRETRGAIELTPRTIDHCPEHS